MGHRWYRVSSGRTPGQRDRAGPGGSVAGQRTCEKATAGSNAEAGQDDEGRFHEIYATTPGTGGVYRVEATAAAVSTMWRRSSSWRGYPRSRCPSSRCNRSLPPLEFAESPRFDGMDRADVGVRQIDLVDDRNNRQPLFVGEMHVRHGLRFHALRRIDDQERAFARGQRARNFIGEIDMPGRIEQVEPVFSHLRAVTHRATECALMVIPRSRSRSIESRS